MKKRYYLFAFVFGLGIGIIFALLFAPYSSKVLKQKIKDKALEEQQLFQKKSCPIKNKIGVISNTVSDLYRLYTHQDEIIKPQGEHVFTKEFF